MFPFTAFDNNRNLNSATDFSNNPKCENSRRSFRREFRKAGRDVVNRRFSRHVYKFAYKA